MAQVRGQLVFALKNRVRHSVSELMELCVIRAHVRRITG